MNKQLYQSVHTMEGEELKDSFYLDKQNNLKIKINKIAIDMKANIKQQA